MKKSGICLIIYLLILSILITPVTLGRYNNTVYGVAWDIYFSNKTIDTDTFHISNDSFVKVDPETGEENILDKISSENLWGAKGNITDWEDSNQRSPYKVGNLSNTEFSLKNNSNNNLLVTFKIAVCAPDAILGDNDIIKIPFTITNINTNASIKGSLTNGTLSDSTFVSLIKGEHLYTATSKVLGLFSRDYDYYEYTGLVNPASIKEISAPTASNLEGFVIPADSNITYTFVLSVDFSVGLENWTGGSTESIYSSIEIIVEKIS